MAFKDGFGERMERMREGKAEARAPDDLSVPRFEVNTGSRELGKLPAKHVLAAGTDGPGSLRCNAPHATKAARSSAKLCTTS